MPTYEYECASCHQGLEAFQKISDAPLTECPHCQKESLKRKVGGSEALFHFKGKGFYTTDYKSKNSSSGCCPCGKNSGHCK